MDYNKVTYFAQTDSRNRRVRFGIKNKDRSRHFYVIGKTGMGKSTILENQAIQDIQNGNGMAFIDPHGKTAELLLDYVPEERIKDVVYFAPFDLDFPISFNVLEDIGYDKRFLVVNGLMSAFKKIWVDAWSARMEYILNNILLALLETPGSTLLGVNRMLSDKKYRDSIVSNVKDPSVKSFWTDEFAKYGDRYMQEAGAAIQNKVGQFVSNPLIRNIIGQPHSSFDIRQMMDEQKILIINLSKGRVGEANANLLGGMLVTKIYLAAMSRADAGEEELEKLPDFYLFVDEFQNFANESFADILSEARKYKLCLTIAHQYIEQMQEEVRAAVFGNVGTMVTFRVGAYDAEVLEKEFAPTFTSEDLVNLDKFQVYLKLMIDGVGSQPFSATTLPNPEPLPTDFYQRIVDASRQQFAKPRMEVESDIIEWHKEITSKDGGVNNKKNTQKRSDNYKNQRNTGPDYTPLPMQYPAPMTNAEKEQLVGNKKASPFLSSENSTTQTHNPFRSVLKELELVTEDQAEETKDNAVQDSLTVVHHVKKQDHKNDLTKQKDKENKLADLRSALQQAITESKTVNLETQTIENIEATEKAIDLAAIDRVEPIIAHDGYLVQAEGQIAQQDTTKSQNDKTPASSIKNAPVLPAQPQELSQEELEKILQSEE